MNVRQPIPADAFDHGDVRRYRRGCTCRACVTAATAEHAKWAYLRQTGRGGHVPADKAIAHIWKLRAAGMTDAEIRTAAELAPPHLYQILRTQAPLLHSTATRILQVPVPERADGPTRNGAGVPGLGTRRRLQALTADGWPAKVLDRHCDTGSGYTAYLLRGDANGTIRMSTADTVHAVYDELAGQHPEDHGVPASLAKQARERAAAKGWAGSGYWDDDEFDNPNYTPATTDRELKRDELAAFRRAEIEHLEQFNLSEHEIADRLGMAYTTVRNIVLEIRSGQRRVRPREGAAA